VLYPAELRGLSLGLRQIVTFDQQNCCPEQKQVVQTGYEKEDQVVQQVL
jgi:hypothetical protein